MDKIQVNEIAYDEYMNFPLIDDTSFENTDLSKKIYRGNTETKIGDFAIYAIIEKSESKIKTHNVEFHLCKII